jgi:hypothetical protein
MTVIQQVSQQKSLEATKSEALEAEVVIDEKAWLNDSEKAALARFKEIFQKGGVETYRLSTTKALQLYSLFLDGSTLTEISELNPEVGLGTIVNSAVEGAWNLKKKEYLDELYNRAKDRAVQTVAEGANFVATLLATAHKKHGQKLKRFLQTEDPKELADCMTIDSLRSYREGVEILMKLTGQDNIKKVQVTGEVTHSDAPPPPKEPEPTPISLATSISQLAALKRAEKEEKSCQ